MNEDHSYTLATGISINKDSINKINNFDENVIENCIMLEKQVMT